MRGEGRRTGTGVEFQITYKNVDKTKAKACKGDNERQICGIRQIRQQQRLQRFIFMSSSSEIAVIEQWNSIWVWNGWNSS